MITVERVLNAWLVNPEDYVAGDPPEYYLTEVLGMERQGWLLLSKHTAKVEIAECPVDVARAKSIEALREMVRKIDAEAERAKTQLFTKINNLLAISDQSR